MSTLPPPAAGICTGARTHDAARLLARALSVQRAADAGASLAELLAQRHIGLITARPDSAAARLFRRAAQELGARVTEIGLGQIGGAASGACAGLQATMRVLSRLYAALECQGLPAATVSALSRGVSVPVYDGLARASHASAALRGDLSRALSQRPGGAVPQELARRRIIQAVLLEDL